MFLLKLYTFSFVLFSVMMYTNSKTTLRETVDQLDKMLRYSGWKNLNDLISITYYRKVYYLQKLIKIPTKRTKGGQKIRALTIYLGCTYSKVMNDLLLVIINVLKVCRKKFVEENDIKKGCICTEQLVNIISLLISPLATLLKDAMDALDLLHEIPMAYYKNIYKISPNLGKIGNILDNLNERTLSRNNISSYLWTLNTIEEFYQKIGGKLYNDTVLYCEFVTFNTSSLWKEWNIEYNAIINKNIKLGFFKFLKGQIKNYIKTIIVEKYFQLGFKYDPFLEETFIPISYKSFEIELDLKKIDEEPPIPIQIENH
ncbi:uncharacterized protein LOC126905302 [Daktulosphaira vitifoliae]|uniref:uncharacterized protein LOC126905302 n=1 Tax=Daktulosphaira vitifoliae TaxID=58002 RepID=UPI0021AAE75A|nr:uncharacterized protein LOC126905302 [Daktulosphaira vitifoliae]XP_050540828.1 uncharacterized protein LOC126905302 [Daktulosphaira vitifoliae]